MPQWTTNVVTLSGSAQDIALAKKTLFAVVDAYEDGKPIKKDCPFSFATLVPIPEGIKKLDEVTFGPSFVAEVKQNPDRAPDAQFTAEDIALAKVAVANIDKYGVWNSVEWGAKMWGTKWDAQACSLEDETAEMLQYQFETPWTYPEKVFLALLEKFPTLHIKWESHYWDDIETLEEDEDGDNVYGEIWVSRTSIAVSPGEHKPGKTRAFEEKTYMLC